MTAEEKLKESIYCVYHPDAEKIMKKLAKKWRKEGLDCHFGYLRGIPIIDDRPNS